MWGIIDYAKARARQWICPAIWTDLGGEAAPHVRNLVPGGMRVMVDATVDRGATGLRGPTGDPVRGATLLKVSGTEVMVWNARCMPVQGLWI